MAVSTIRVDKYSKKGSFCNVKGLGYTPTPTFRKKLVWGYTLVMERGHIHPISSLVRESNKIFSDMGFTLVESPLLESEYYNFDGLNFPKDHPARDMQDTFFIKDEPGYLLRTHTSAAQVRYPETQLKKNIAPPYRAISIGKVFRNEATDITHEAEFFQIEGKPFRKVHGGWRAEFAIEA